MQFFGGSGGGDASPSPSAPAGAGSGVLGSNTYMMYIFNRNGVCLLYREWHRPLRTLDAHQDHKLMFGLLFSLRSFTAKMDPTSADKGSLGVPLLPGQGCSFHCFRTNTYKLNFMESPSGIKPAGGYTVHIAQCTGGFLLNRVAGFFLHAPSEHSPYYLDKEVDLETNSNLPKKPDRDM